MKDKNFKIFIKSLKKDYEDCSEYSAGFKDFRIWMGAGSLSIVNSRIKFTRKQKKEIKKNVMDIIEDELIKKIKKRGKK